MTDRLRPVIHRRPLLVLLAAIVVAVAGVIGVLVWQAPRSGSSDAGPTSRVQPMTITAGQPIVLGRSEARATVTLYTDFHCATCADLQDRLSDTLLRAERDGSARLEIYPVSAVDPGSAAAANALACAAEAGGAESYYLGLFADPTMRWTNSNLVELGNNSVLASGSEVDFERCVTSQRHTDWVGSINAVANDNGIAAAPTLLLNGSPLDLTTLTPDILAGEIEEANR